MKVLTILMFSFSLRIAYSQGVGEHLQSNTVSTSFPFLLFSPDARSSGLGDVGSALSPTANSFHWNTSNLGFSNDVGALSVSYSPWLRQLVNDIHLLYISGYTKFGSNARHSAGGSIRYLSDANNFVAIGTGTISDQIKSNDLELLGGYSIRIFEKSSIGANGKFIFSDAIQNANPDSLNVSPALAAALDISYGYLSEQISIGEMQSHWSFGIAISNLGNKSFYTSISEKDFLPANIRIGSAFGLNIRAGHKITASLDFNKLMVPVSNANMNNVNAIQGVFRSFVDSQDGFIGEIREITFGTGLEYNCKDLFSLRTGCFHEHPSLGTRRFVSFGAGVQLKSIGVDVSYLASLTQNNPLANTIRFSLSYRFKGLSE